MKLLLLQDIQLNENEHIFKESSVWQFLTALFFSSLPFLPFGIIFLYKVEKLALYLLSFSGVCLTLFAFVFISSFIKSLSSDNWLIRLDQNRIIIKFRSYLNHFLPNTINKSLLSHLMKLRKSEQ